MTAAEARKLVHADTFRPFQVVTHDGRRFEAPTYVDVLASWDELLIGVDYDPKTGIAESMERLRYDEIRGYEFVTPEPIAVAA